MNIRPYRASDAEHVKALYSAEKHGDQENDFGGTEIVTAMVITDDQDIPRIILGAKRTVEMMLVVDSSWSSPATRWASLKMLFAETMKRLFSLGYRSNYCWVLEKNVKAYGRRLRSLGWMKTLGTCFELRAK